MPTFTYTARTRKGEKTEGTVEAADRHAAMAQIERLGHIPVAVAEKSAAAQAAKRTRHFSWHGRRERMGTRDLLFFTTELSDLLASGMKLGNALNALSSRPTGRAGDQIIPALRDEIIRGTSLSDALALHPATFSGLYVSMIRAGEASGALDEVLQRLVTHYEKIQETKEKVIMAFTYPVIVIVLGCATLVYAMVAVIPKFQMIFREMGQALPLPTRILIGSSAWLAHYGWLAAIVVAFGGVMANRAVKTPAGRLWWHGFLLKVPLIRGIVASSIYAGFARTLGTLMSNGVQVLQALSIVEKTIGNAVVAREIRNARDRVTDGTTISGPLAAGKVFPPIMTDMLAIGEQSGDITGALSHIARRYDTELDRNVKLLTTALEPILIVGVALMVGFVAVSVLMAVFNMTNGLNV